MWIRVEGAKYLIYALNMVSSACVLELCKMLTASSELG